MKRAVSMFLCLGGLMAFASVGRANVNDAPSPGAGDSADASNSQPYSPIWVRNVFDLKPNLPPAITNTQPAAPPLNVRLIGITTIFGNKRATVGVQETGKDAGSKKEDYYTMTEGERRGSLELLEINPTSRPPTIKIKKDESVSTLTFETNKIASPAPIAGAPHPLTMPGYGQPQPAGMSSGMAPPAPLPNRMMRSTPQGNMQPNYGAAGFSSGYNNSANTAQPEQPVAPEVTAALMNLQQADAQNKNRPFPPLPPGFSIPTAPPTDQVPSPPTGKAPPAFPPGLGPRSSGNFSGAGMGRQ